MKKISVFANQKGGVGKTTCAVNVGFELARRGRSVLLIDMDPQANMTTWCGQDPDSFDATIYDVLKGTSNIDDIKVKVKEKVHLAPSNILLASIEREIFAAIGYERRLKKAIQEITENFNHILIDCPPSLGTLTVNGLVASDEVYIAVACEHLSVIGTNKLLETIDAVRDNYNAGLEIGRVIPTMFTNTVLAGEMVKQLSTFFGDTLAKTKIRRNVKIGESSAMGQSIMEYDLQSIGAQDFISLVEEII
ncbi:MAG: ParA family protein [Candidatus Latescibacteria bacterium]|nr:ParA family protein [Candidatus Latescibacterota bacterium]